MQQQLRDNLQCHEAEVQHLKGVVAFFQDSREKVKEAAGDREGSGRLSREWTQEERDGRSSVEELLAARREEGA